MLSALDFVVHFGGTGSDRFRQWLYPNLPIEYSINSNLNAEIELHTACGLSAYKTARLIQKNHS